MEIRTHYYDGFCGTPPFGMILYKTELVSRLSIPHFSMMLTFLFCVEGMRIPTYSGGKPESYSGFKKIHNLKRRRGGTEIHYMNLLSNIGIYSDISV